MAHQMEGTERFFMGYIMHMLIAHHLNGCMYLRLRAEEWARRWKKAVSSDMFWHNEHFLTYKFDTRIIHNCIVRRPSSSSSSSSLSAESKTGNCNNIQSNKDDDDDTWHRVCGTWKWQDIVVDEIEWTKSCALYVCQITLRLKRERQADNDDGSDGVGSLRKQLHYRATWYSFELDAAFMFRFYAHVCLYRCVRLLFFTLPFRSFHCQKRVNDNLTVIWTHCTYLHLERFSKPSFW